MMPIFHATSIPSFEVLIKFRELITLTRMFSRQPQQQLALIFLNDLTYCLLCNSNAVAPYWIESNKPAVTLQQVSAKLGRQSTRLALLPPPHLFFEQIEAWPNDIKPAFIRTWLTDRCDHYFGTDKWFIKYHNINHNNKNFLCWHACRQADYFSWLKSFDCKPIAQVQVYSWLQILLKKNYAESSTIKTHDTIFHLKYLNDAYSYYIHRHNGDDPSRDDMQQLAQQLLGKNSD